MPRKGDNIYKRKDGRWEGRFVKGRINGRTLFGSVYGKTRKETKGKLTAAQYEWQEGLSKAKSHRTKLEVVSDAWLKESETFLKESTVAKYRDYMRCYICPKFGKTDMADINDEMLSAFCVNMLEKGGASKQGLSTKTVSEIFRVMKQLRKFAILRKIVVGFTAGSLGIKQKAKPLRVFSQLEQEKLHAYLDESQNRVISVSCSACPPGSGSANYAPLHGTIFLWKNKCSMFAGHCNGFVTMKVPAQKPRS